MSKSWGLALAAIVVALGACTPKRATRKGAGGGTSPAVAGAEASIRGAGFAPATGIDDVVFAYDASALSAEARATLKKNAELLALNPNLEVLIEGHCDDRGTIEYNLALGQRRATAVRDYYVLLGVDRARLATISYGKERPVCSEAAEDCRAANRRAEHKTRARLPADAADARP